MQATGLRWTRLCVASTATALFSSVAPSAFATQTHALKPGETLDALARKYHVSVPDLIRANGIENQDAIPDGKVLTIPNPPRSLRVEATMHREAHVGKDSASVRLGPGLEYRRMNFVYEGDSVTVTAERDGWVQISAEDGVRGWMLKSLLHSSHNKVEGEQTASSNGSETPTRRHKPTHHATMTVVEEDRNRARKVARHKAGTAIASHKRHTQHQEPREERHVVAHNRKPAHKHGRQIAKIEHESVTPRRHHHSEDREPAVNSHKRVAKRHTHEESTRIARSHKKTHVSEEHVASVTHHKQRRHHSESSEQVTQVRHRRHSVTPEANAPAASNDIVRTAYAYRGTPYVWGGERPGGFDCSGFTLHLYGRKGVNLPHSARAQFGMGQKVEKKGMKPGDLVFFHTVTPGISHVGMYVGNGKFVHASSRRSGGVRVDNIESGYYSKAFRGARRMRKND